MYYHSKALGCPPCGQQQIKNRGFEQRLSHWITQNTVAVNVPSVVHQGLFSAFLGVNSANTASISQDIPVTSKCGFRFSVFIRSALVNKSTTAQIKISFRNSSGISVGLPLVINIPGNSIPALYAPFFTEISIPNGASITRVTISKLNSGSILVDNVSLISVPPIS